MSKENAIKIFEQKKVLERFEKEADQRRMSVVRKNRTTEI